MSKPVRWRPPRTVLLLGWVSFFADVCSELVYPVIPLFLKHTLRAPALSLGIVEGIAEAVVSFMKGWSGLRSDVTGRRVPYIRWGYGLSAIGKPLLALATGLPMVLAARATDRLGKGIRTTARDSLIADAVGKEHYGKAFGFHRAMDTAGALVGVLGALWLLRVLPGQYRAIFLLAAIPGALAVALCFLLQEPPRAQVHPSAPPNPKPGIPLRQALRSLPAGYWRALSVGVLFGLANSSDTFLLLRASELGLSDVQVVLAYAAYNVTYMLLSYPAGHLSDRVGRWPVLALGWTLYGVVYLGFAWLGAAWLWPLFALYGIYIGLTQGVSKALVADHAPAERRGTAMGLYYMATGFATLFAGILTGLLYTFSGPAVAFVVCASLAFAAALAVPLTARRKGIPGPK